MKKCNFVKYTMTLLALFSIASCSSNSVEQLRKDFAISELNAEDYKYEHTYLSEKYKLIGDYYYESGNSSEYTSIFNGSIINADNLYKKYINNITIYYDNSNSNSNISYYDSFGNKIDKLEKLDSDSYYTTKYLIVAENSPLYESLCGVSEGHYKNSSNLKIVEMTYLNESDEIVLLKGYGDTHFYARNVFSLIDNKFDTVIVDDLSQITKLNDTEYRVNIEDNYFRVKALSSNDSNSRPENLFDGNVEKISEDNWNYVGVEFTDIINLAFAGSTCNFYYAVRTVPYFSNDFDFVYNGKKYDAYYTTQKGSVSDPGFVLDPNSIIYSKDMTYAAVLGTKILDEGILSNTYYTFIIHNDLSIDKGTKDTTIFENNGDYIFNDELNTLKDEESLVILDEDIKVIDCDTNLHIYTKEIVETGNRPHETTGKYTLLTTSSINGVYMFRSGVKDIIEIDVRYSFLNRETGEFMPSPNKVDKMITESGIYKSGNTIFAGRDEITSVDDDFYATNHKLSAFDTKEEVLVINHNSNYSGSPISIIKLNVNDN